MFFNQYSSFNLFFMIIHSKLKFYHFSYVQFIIYSFSYPVIQVFYDTQLINLGVFLQDFYWSISLCSCRSHRLTQGSPQFGLDRFSKYCSPRQQFALVIRIKNDKKVHMCKSEKLASQVYFGAEIKHVDRVYDYFPL